MDDANKPKEKGGKEISPALLELINSKATGTSASDEVPLPEEMLRVRRDLRELHAEQETEQGPERFIGPRNPDHPNVNRDQGGRKPA